MPRSRTIIIADPVESAVAAGLRYIRETTSGISRRRAGKGWCFLDTSGKPIRDSEVLNRIRALVIPPAWQKVWICAMPHGHLQAIGYDARGRKQYRYHAKYSLMRNHSKFSRLPEFGRRLPVIRARVEADLGKPGLSREKVLATVVKLLETTYIRIGNEEYMKQNQSFGLTTLQNQHVDVEGADIKFHFRGKSGQDHEIELHDRRLARVIRECQELPGHELFQYREKDGTRHTINSEDVNNYLREIAGHGFTAKDFRTLAGTVLASQALAEMGPAGSETEAKRNIAAVVKATARKLGNRPATCRKYYIHPAVLESYGNGTLFQYVKPAEHPDEKSVLAMIEKLNGCIAA